MRTLFNVSLFILLLIYYAILNIVIFILLVFIYIIFYKTRFKDRLSAFIRNLWFKISMSVMMFYFAEDITVYYDATILHLQKCVIISNHQTNYDWWFFACVLDSLNMYSDLYVVLKESISNIPFVGWAMKMIKFVFISRKLETDQQLIVEKCEEFKKMQRYNLLIFPEGTVIESESLEKSKEYCEKNKIFINGKIFNPSLVLLPRTAGISLILNNISQDIDGIVDITIFTDPYEKYPYEKYGFKDIFLYRTNKLKFSFIIDFFPMCDELKAKEWLYKVFNKKENLLKLICEGRLKTNGSNESVSDINKIRKEVDIKLEGLNSKKVKMGSNLYYIPIILFYSSIIAFTLIRILKN